MLKFNGKLRWFFIVIIFIFSLSGLAHAEININFPYTNTLDADSDFANIIWASEGNDVSRVTSGCWSGSCARITPRAGQSYAGLGGFVLSDNPTTVHVRFLWKQDDEIYSTASSVGYGIQNKAVIFMRSVDASVNRAMAIIDDDCGGYFAWTACSGSNCYYDDGEGPAEKWDGHDSSEFIKHPPLEEWYSVEVWVVVGGPTYMRTTKQDGTYVEWQSGGSNTAVGYWNLLQIIGGFFNGATSSGYVYIDELKIDDSYIGPPAGFVGAPPTYECSDSIDNDGDGQTDYPNDAGCSSSLDNDETNCGDGVCEGGETCTVDCGPQDWDWYESFDDPADFTPPGNVGGTYFYRTDSTANPNDGGVFFLDNFGRDIGTYFSDNHAFAAWHIDRPGNGRAFQIASNDPEIDSCLGSIDGNLGKRWKFDIWFGPSSGTYAHEAGDLKFIYLLGGSQGAHFRVISQKDLTGWQTSSEVYRTDLNGGRGSTCAEMSCEVGPRIIIWEGADMIIQNTAISRETWHTLEIQFDQDTRRLKMWLDGQLDFDYICTSWGQESYTGFDFIKYSTSAGGSIYLALDNFYKYDTLKAETTTECSDSQDNDGDSQTDYPNDSGCTSLTDNDETDCPDGVCEGGETCTDCPGDCLQAGEACCSGVAYNPATQVCCSGTVYTGDCCEDANCTGTDQCINHVCTPQAGTTVSVDSTYPGYTTDPIDDGVIDPYGAESTTWASEESSTDPHWVAIDFSQPREISNVTIYWAYNSFRDAFMSPQELWVQYWDGSGYANASIITNTEEVQNSYSSFPAIGTTGLRLFQPPNMGYPDYPVVMWLTEIDYFQSYHRADTNQDGCITLQELLAFIKRWKVSSRDVPMPEVMEAMGLWKSGTGCG